LILVEGDLAALVLLAEQQQELRQADCFAYWVEPAQAWLLEVVRV
jgi:hypothetical protein